MPDPEVSQVRREGDRVADRRIRVTQGAYQRYRPAVALLIAGVQDVSFDHVLVRRNDLSRVPDTVVFEKLEPSLVAKLCTMTSADLPGFLVVPERQQYGDQFAGIPGLPGDAFAKSLERPRFRVVGADCRIGRGE